MSAPHDSDDREYWSRRIGEIIDGSRTFTAAELEELGSSIDYSTIRAVGTPVVGSSTADLHGYIELCEQIGAVVQPGRYRDTTGLGSPNMGSMDADELPWLGEPDFAKNLAAIRQAGIDVGNPCSEVPDDGHG